MPNKQIGEKWIERIGNKMFWIDVGNQQPVTTGNIDDTIDDYVIVNAIHRDNVTFWQF